MTDTTTEEAPRVVKHETLGEAVCSALLEMEAVGKSGTNKRDGYDFRTVDDVMAAVRTPFARHGVWLRPTFGTPRPVLDVAHEKHDPHFIEVDIALKLVHAHSAQYEVIQGVGRGRMAGSGNVSIPDPRVIGQAISYGMKALLINAFQLAGGDDSADEAPKADAPPPSRRKSEPEREAADPHTEEARRGLLDDIATLSPDTQQRLKDWCKELGISVRHGDLAELEAVADKVAKLADVEILASEGSSQLLTTEEVPGIVEQVLNEAPAEDDPMASDAYLAEEQALTLEQEAALVAARQKAAEAHLQRVHPAGQDLPEPERHLNAVPDEPEQAPEKPARRKTTRKPDVESVPTGTGQPDNLTDAQLCYLVASDGKADNSDGLGTDKDALRRALRLNMDLRGPSPKLRRKGLTLIDANGEVVADGTEAVALWRSAG